MKQKLWTLKFHFFFSLNICFTHFPNWSRQYMTNVDLELNASSHLIFKCNKLPEITYFICSNWVYLNYWAFQLSKSVLFSQKFVFLTKLWHFKVYMLADMKTWTHVDHILSLMISKFCVMVGWGCVGDAQVKAVYEMTIPCMGDIEKDQEIPQVWKIVLTCDPHCGSILC